jgi:hypothetical protein
MNRHVVALFLLLVLFGCAQKGAPPGVHVAGAAQKPADAANRYLAYEHSIGIDVGEDRVGPLFDTAQAACREATAESCAILEAQVTRGDSAYATLKLRAKPEGIRKLIAMLSSQGRVASQATTAEDLAGPIEDTAKKLAMQTDYRGKLEVLRARSNNDVDALIKINRELAQTQSEIELLAGQQAHLVQRVETEILNVAITSYRSRSFWRPIAESASGFAGNLSDGIATAITALAYIIPWSLVLLLIVWAARKLWARRGKRPAVT